VAMRQSRGMRAAGLILLVGSLLVAHSAAQDDIDGCGGFVRASSSLSSSATKPDLSTVHATLLSADGVVKSTAECSPNGYFYLPIYDKETYTLKVQGPPGFLFEPSQQKVSTTDGLCGQSKDVDFTIVGFALAGRVLSYGSDDGPEGVLMTLSGGDGAKSTSKTTKGGHYSFADAKPGVEYTITASHPEWKFKKASTKAKLVFGASEVPETFGVLGYGVSAKVNSDALMSFTLHPESSSAPRPDFLSCAAPTGGGGGWCQATSDAQGNIRMAGVPPGSYILKPQVGDKVDMSPSQVSVVVEHGTVLVSGEFELKGFAVSGKVIDAEGAAVAGAEVLLDGAKAATTNAKGAYTLKVGKAGRYTVTAAKQHHSFATLEKYDVSPSLVRVSSVQATGYSVCGRVAFESASPAKRKVTVEGKGVSQAATTDGDGAFCFDGLAPGDYRLSVAPVQGVIVTPASLPVSTRSGPVLDAAFGQASLHIKGRVECRAPPCEGVAVRVSGAGAPAPTKTGRDGAFAFLNVAPGKYSVSVERAGWCWEGESAKAAVVGKDDTTQMVFRQGGFQASITSSHDVSVTAAPSAGGAAEPLALTKGKNSVCMSSSSDYTIEPHDCFRFGKPTTFSASAPLSLVASEGKVKVSVTSPSALASLSLTASASPSPVKPGKGKAKNGGTVYEFTHWVPLGGSSVVSPEAPGSGLLFNPPSAEVRPGGAKGCSKVAAEFKAVGGASFSGVVSPAMAGVVVSAAANGREVGSVTTKADGAFQLGPFEGGVQYELRAEKRGYTFVSDGEGGFRSVKMGELPVSCVDEAGESMPGVLLSLSGENAGFRQNNRTGTDGSYSFTGLEPGTYFLRPMLKEYELSPASQSISVQEGTNPTVQLRAKRVAFSVLGSVKGLDGRQDKHATVVATNSAGTAVETASTEAGGEYRLRGLKPGEKYAISVNTAPSAKHERATPASVDIVMGKDDKKGVDFVAFRRPAKADVVGRVLAEREHLSSISVEIASAGNPHSPIQTVPLMVSDYFEFHGVPRGDYVVRSTTTLDKRGYKILTEQVKVHVDGDATFAEVPFSAVPRSQSDEVGPVSFSVLVVLVLGAFGILNHKEIIEKLSSTPSKTPSDQSYGINPVPDQQKKRR